MYPLHKMRKGLAGLLISGMCCSADLVGPCLLLFLHIPPLVSDISGEDISDKQAERTNMHANTKHLHY